jgi:hypothetical protein
MFKLAKYGMISIFIQPEQFSVLSFGYSGMLCKSIQYSHDNIISLGMYGISAKREQSLHFRDTIFGTLDMLYN